MGPMFEILLRNGTDEAVTFLRRPEQAHSNVRLAGSELADRLVFNVFELSRISGHYELVNSESGPSEPMGTSLYPGDGLVIHWTFSSLVMPGGRRKCKVRVEGFEGEAQCPW